MYNFINLKKVKLIFTDLKGESYPLKSFKRDLSYEITELRAEICYLHSGLRILKWKFMHILKDL